VTYVRLHGSAQGRDGRLLLLYDPNDLLDKINSQVRIGLILLVMLLVPLREEWLGGLLECRVSPSTIRGCAPDWQRGGTVHGLIRSNRRQMR